MSTLLEGFQSYKPVMLAVKKKVRHFGLKATFFASFGDFYNIFIGFCKVNGFAEFLS